MDRNVATLAGVWPGEFGAGAAKSASQVLGVGLAS
jgi:hypothetical protein